MGDKAIVALPCPFCGGAPVIKRTMQEYPAEGEHPAGDYEAWAHVACDACGIEMGAEYRDEVIAAWNSRSNSTAEDAAAYGLLWRMRTTDKAVHDARRSLLATIGRDGQRAGISWALATFGPTEEPGWEDLP